MKVLDQKGIENKIFLEYSYPIGIKKILKNEILIINIHMIYKKIMIQH